MGSDDQPQDGAGAVASDATAQPIDQVKELLEEHVPLSLIMDLTAPGGPNSAAILDAEGSPEDEWWAEA